jgi:rhamnogalacturonan endolyase
MYVDYDQMDGDAITHSHPFPPGSIKLLRATPDLAEIVLTCPPNTSLSFSLEEHYLLRRGDSGIYVYLLFHHGAGMPAVNFVQSRLVVRGVSGGKIFTNYVIDDDRKGPYPAGSIVDTVQDTTWKYSDGSIHTKYDYCAFIADDLVFGMAGHGLGLWIIQPSREYVNGGPVHQELTVHQAPAPNNGPQQNIMQWIVQGMHYGAPDIPLAAGQEWTRFYGPAFVYINHAPAVDALWADAQNQARQEQSKWPYSFINHPAYPLERGSVSGRVKLTDGTSAAAAWVVLAPPGTVDWTQSGLGYEFWTKTDSSGRFLLSKVRPGNYTLFVSGANQFEDFRHAGVCVAPGVITDLGVLDWAPITHGQKLWQIGCADHSSREFKDGLNVRHYDNFILYAKNFPNDVTFTIGQSHEASDWNYAQWGWYVKKPYWSILFNLPKPLTGTATLTFGIVASSNARPLLVTVNGSRIGSVPLRRSGTAIHRSGGQDSLYQLAYLPFNAALLKPGSNEIQIALKGAVPFAHPDLARPTVIGGVMYDAIRLEVDPRAAFAPAPAQKHE